MQSVNCTSREVVERFVRLHLEWIRHTEEGEKNSDEVRYSVKWKRNKFFYGVVESDRENKGIKIYNQFPIIDGKYATCMWRLIKEQLIL